LTGALKRQSSSTSFSIPSQRFKDKVEETSVFGSVSRKSSQGSKGSRQGQKLAMSRLKLRQLEEKKELLQRRQNLEAEIYERRLKTEMDKLELQNEIIDARVEMEKCAIESQFSAKDECSELERDFGEKLPNVQKQTLEETMEKCLQSSGPERYVKKLSATNQPEDPYPRRATMGLNPDFHDLFERQTQLIEGQNATVERLTSSLDLPKREFLRFDGNPTTYLRFIKNFELNVESRVQDNTIRLSYLIQYTDGAAREAIENCVILPADVGYARAKEILRKTFGQKHNIVRAFVEKVVNGQQIKAGEPEKLLQLARDMRNCLMNSLQMKYRADVNAMDTLMKIVKRLPPYLQAK
jgi:hypothetical protein